MAFKNITAEKKQNVGLITLDRPKAMNALNPELTQELHDALDEAGDAFPDVRTLVLTGAGRGFCSGPT